MQACGQEQEELKIVFPTPRLYLVPVSRPTLQFRHHYEINSILYNPVNKLNVIESPWRWHLNQEVQKYSLVAMAAGIIDLYYKCETAAYAAN